MTNRIVILAIAIGLVVFVILNPLAGQPTAVQESMAVTVPEAINMAITVGLTALLAMGAGWLFEKVGIDLRGVATTLAITLSAFIVSELQNIVDMIPEMYDPTLDLVFKIIVVLLGSVGLLRFRIRMLQGPSDPPTAVGPGNSPGLLS